MVSVATADSFHASPVSFLVAASSVGAMGVITPLTASHLIAGPGTPIVASKAFSSNHILPSYVSMDPVIRSGHIIAILALPHTSPTSLE